MNDDLEKKEGIIELNSDSEEINDIESDIEDEVFVKPKKKAKFSFKDLPKKTRIIILSIIGVIILAVIIVLLVVFVFKKNKNGKNNKENIPKKDPVVIVEKDNYRYENGALFFTKDGTDLGKYNCNNKDASLCYVSFYGNEKTLDVPTYIYEDGNKEYSTRSDLSENFAFVVDGADANQIIFYDVKNQDVKETYEEVKEYNEEYVIVKKDEKYGLISLKDGSYKIPIEYDYLGSFPERPELSFKKGSLYGLLDADGKELTKDIDCEIKTYNEHVVVINNGDKYKVLDYEGNNLSISGNYIEFVEGYLCVLKQGLYVYNPEGVLLNIEPILVKGENNGTKHILNTRNKVIKTERIFDLYDSDDEIKIGYKDDYYSINKYEGIVSHNYKYVSYYNQKLYFYNDDKKETLIGTYKCINKNVVDKDTTEFVNCMVAKESKLLNRESENTEFGYLPIYNNNIVFINDIISTGATENIIMYQMAENKNVGTYTKVDAGYYQNNPDVQHVDATDDIRIAAIKSTSGSHGIVYISGPAVKPLIKFEYDEIKIYDENHYVAKSLNGNTLFGVDGKKSITTKNEIVKITDKYIIVKDGNLYQIYENKENGSIISNTFKYIDLQEEYYVGIDSDNKLNVYSYDDKNGILDYEPEITNTNYENAYTITYNGKELIEITLFDNDNQVKETCKYINGKLDVPAPQETPEPEEPAPEQPGEETPQNNGEEGNTEE